MISVGLWATGFMIEADVVELLADLWHLSFLLQAPALLEQWHFPMKSTTAHFHGVLGFFEHWIVQALLPSTPLCLLESDVKAPHLDSPGFNPNPLALLLTSAQPASRAGETALFSLEHVVIHTGSGWSQPSLGMLIIHTFHYRVICSQPAKHSLECKPTFGTWFFSSPSSTLQLKGTLNGMLAMFVWTEFILKQD